MQAWTPRGTRTVYRDARLTVRRNRYQIPSRKIVDYTVVDYRDMAGIVALTPDRKLLLVRQYRAPVNKVTLEIPAGMVDGMDPAAAALKELVEETGFRSTQATKMVSVHPLIGRLTATTHLFFTDRLTKAKKKTDEVEDIETVAVTPAEALELIRRGEIQDAASVTAILYAHSQNLLGA